VVSTKVGRRLVPTPERASQRDPEFDVPATHERVRDYSRDGVRRSLDDSMARLGLDHVDIVYVHDPDGAYAETAFTQAIPALVELREQGVVGAVGVGMNHPEIPCEAIRRTDLDVVMIAGRYTVLEQPALAELLPLALERGVGYVAASVFNSGLLSRPRPTAGLTYDHGPVPPGLLARVNALADLAERYGVQLPDVAAQFPLRHPAVVSVPLGVRTAEEVAENDQRYHSVVPDQLWSEVESTLLEPPRRGRPS